MPSRCISGRSTQAQNPSTHSRSHNLSLTIDPSLGRSVKKLKMSFVTSERVSRGRDKEGFFNPFASYRKEEKERQQQIQVQEEMRRIALEEERRRMQQVRGGKWVVEAELHFAVQSHFCAHFSFFLVGRRRAKKATAAGGAG